jgi:hypothetical protein
MTLQNSPVDFGGKVSCGGGGGVGGVVRFESG